jgi:hypothetical protein
MQKGLAVEEVEVELFRNSLSLLLKFRWHLLQRQKLRSPVLRQ